MKSKIQNSYPIEEELFVGEINRLKASIQKIKDTELTDVITKKISKYLASRTHGIGLILMEGRNENELLSFEPTLEEKKP